MKLILKELALRQTRLKLQYGEKSCVIEEDGTASLNIEYSEGRFQNDSLDEQVSELLLALLGYRLDPDLGFVKADHIEAWEEVTL